MTEPSVASASADSLSELNAFMAADNSEAVVAIVERMLDKERDPRVVNWCVEWGYRKGHVPVLYHLARNLLRFSNGRVPSLEDLEFGIRCALLLLVRTAQDVISCRMDLAKADLDFIYEAMKDMVRHWVMRWNPDRYVTVARIRDDLDAWFKTVPIETLPLPSWATSFQCSWSYIPLVSKCTMYWVNPVAHDVKAFQRSTTVPATRSSVVREFLNVLAKHESWSAFFAPGGGWSVSKTNE